MTTRPAAGRTLAITALALALAPAPPAAGQGTRPAGDSIPIGNGHLYLETVGDGAPTVLINGGMMDLSMWDGQVESLGQRLRLIRFDTRGAGRSAMSGPYHPSDDVVAILDHLGIERANLVGLSNGGAIAIDFALTHPDRLAALVLAEPGVTGFQFDPEMMARVQQAATQLRARDFPGATETLLAGEAFAWSREHNPDGFAEIERLVTMNLASFVMQGRLQWHEPAALGELSRITAPTLVLVSEHADPNARRLIAELRERLPHAVHGTVPDAGHMMNIDNPDAFNREVLAFLAGAPR